MPYAKKQGPPIKGDPVSKTLAHQRPASSPVFLPDIFGIYGSLLASCNSIWQAYFKRSTININKNTILLFLHCTIHMFILHRTINPKYMKNSASFVSRAPENRGYKGLVPTFIAPHHTGDGSPQARPHHPPCSRQDTRWGDNPQPDHMRHSAQGKLSATSLSWQGRGPLASWLSLSSIC